MEAAPLSNKEKEFAIDKAAKGFNAKEIRELIIDNKEMDGRPASERLNEFLEEKETREKVRTRQQVTEKKAQIQKEDLVETMVDLKNQLEREHRKLLDSEHGVTRNETAKNIIDTVNKIGELIGELDTGGGTKKNVIKIDEFKQEFTQNITKVIKHLDKEKKKDIVEQLEDDESIEDYVIIRKDEADEEDEDEEEDEEEESETEEQEKEVKTE